MILSLNKSKIKKNKAIPDQNKMVTGEVGSKIELHLGQAGAFLVTVFLIAALFLTATFFLVGAFLACVFFILQL